MLSEAAMVFRVPAAAMAQIRVCYKAAQAAAGSNTWCDEDDAGGSVGRLSELKFGCKGEFHLSYRVQTSF